MSAFAGGVRRIFLVAPPLRYLSAGVARQRRPPRPATDADATACVFRRAAPLLRDGPLALLRMRVIRIARMRRASRQRSRSPTLLVTPAKAGVQELPTPCRSHWISACAGMTRINPGRDKPGRDEDGKDRCG